MTRKQSVSIAVNRRLLIAKHKLAAALLLVACIFSLSMPTLAQTATPVPSVYYLEVLSDHFPRSATSGNTGSVTLTSGTASSLDTNPVMGLMYVTNVTRNGAVGGSWNFNFNKTVGGVNNGVGVSMASTSNAYSCSDTNTSWSCNLYNWSSWGIVSTVTASGGSGVTHPQAGDGWRVSYSVSNSPSTLNFSLNYLALIRYGPPPPALNADFTYTPPTNICTGMDVNFMDQSSGNITSHAWDFDDGDTSNLQNPTHVFEAAGNYYVTLTISGPQGTDSATNVVAVSDCISLGRPLTLNDEQTVFDSHLILDWAEDHPGQGISFEPVLADTGTYLVQAMSKQPGAYVHAVADGRVRAITPLTYSMCSAGASAFRNQITETIEINNEPITRTTPWCSTQLPNFANTSLSTAPYYLTIPIFFDVRDMYIVTVSYDDQYLNYIVKNAPLYVQTGDSILKKCVLGETTSLEDTPTFDGVYLDDVLSGVSNGSKIVAGAVATALTGGWGAALTALSLAIPSIEAEPPADISSNQGMTWVWLEYPNGDEDELLSELLEYPTEDDMCNSDAAYAECQSANPEFRASGLNWQTFGTVEFNNPGVTLAPGARIGQQGNLDTSKSYSMTFQAQGVGNTSQMRYWIGNTAVNGISVNSGLNNYTIESDQHEPDAGLFYTYGVENTGDRPIEISFLCVSDGAPNLTPNGCYFANPSFDFGTQDWTVSGSVTGNDGAIILGLDDSISQNVTLYPNQDTSAHTYQGYVIYQGYFTGDPDPSDVRYQLAFDWPSGGTPVNIGPVISMDTIAYPGAIHPQTLTRQSFSFEVDAETNGAFVLTPNISAANSSFVGVRIFELCIAGPFPQQGGAGTSTPFEAKCTVVTKPQGNLTSEWTEYHWQQLNRFFNCDLMVLFSRTYKRLDGGITLFAWQARYWQSSAMLGSAWLATDLFPWLNGHFANMSGRTTVSSGPGVFDVLLALINTIVGPIVGLIVGLVEQAATLIFSVLSGLLTIFFAILGQIVGLVGTLIRQLGGLVGAYNTAAPQAIPGLPTCGLDPKGSAFCIGLWMMENTIFATNAGRVVIPLILGYLATELIEYVIDEVRRIITITGKVA